MQSSQKVLEKVIPTQPTSILQLFKDCFFKILEPPATYTEDSNEMNMETQSNIIIENEGDKLNNNKPIY
ncbi:1326_t:CDS:1, partial [Gigaspora margarita]